MVATSFLLWILSHSSLAVISCNISFLLTFISVKVSFLHGSYFILPWILSHSPLAAVSCNIPFLLACIPLKISFLHVAISFLLWILSHSSLAFISIKFSFHMAATSLSLGFGLIALWQLFHTIFHSSWHLFQLNQVQTWDGGFWREDSSHHVKRSWVWCQNQWWSQKKCQVHWILQPYPHEPRHSEGHYTLLSDKQTTNFCSPKKWTLVNFVVYVWLCVVFCSLCPTFVVFCSLSANFVVYVRLL